MFWQMSVSRLQLSAAGVSVKGAHGWSRPQTLCQIQHKWKIILHRIHSASTLNMRRCFQDGEIQLETFFREAT